MVGRVCLGRAPRIEAHSLLADSRVLPHASEGPDCGGVSITATLPGTRDGRRPRASVITAATCKRRAARSFRGLEIRGKVTRLLKQALIEKRKHGVGVTG